MSRALSNSAGQAGATLFAVVVLVWSAANVTAGFETVVARVEDAAHESPSGRLVDATSILGSVGLSVGSVVAASALFVLLPSVVPAAVGLGFLFVTLSVVLLPSTTSRRANFPRRRVGVDGPARRRPVLRRERVAHVPL